MRRFAMVAAGAVLGVFALAAGSTAAWADGPQHVKTTFPFQPPPQPAGAFCNFTYGEVATVTLNAIIPRAPRPTTSRSPTRTRIWTPVSR